MTASASHAQKFGRNVWTSTLAGGLRRADPQRTQRSPTVRDLGHLGVTFVRGEYVMKSGEDLALTTEMEDETFGVAMLSLGHTQSVLRKGGLETSLGIRANAERLDAELEPYGTRFPVGVMAFLQLQPAMAH